MFTLKKENYKNIIALLIISFINGVYFFKYSEIYLHRPLVFTPLYLLIFWGIILLLDKKTSAKFTFISSKFFIYLSSALVVASVCWITFVPRLGQIGRFPAINDWLARILSGKFPYTYPITPSGFPFLFIISLPFYLIGNVGLLEVCGLILFISLVIYSAHSKKEILFKILILLMCPVFCYGFVVRDELFFNMMLAIILIFTGDKLLNTGKINIKFIIFAILFGLVLATRSVVAVIYAIYLIHKFKSNITNGIIFSAISAVTFGLLVLPFYLWNPQSFNTYGPFAVQSHLSYLPIWIVFAAIGFSIYLGWNAVNIREVFFSCGIMLFLLAFISMFFRIGAVGINNAIINDAFDISYYIFCIPFLILAMKENKPSAVI